MPRLRHRNELRAWAKPVLGPAKTIPTRFILLKRQFRSASLDLREKRKNFLDCMLIRPPEGREGQVILLRQKGGRQTSHYFT